MRSRKATDLSSGFLYESLSGSVTKQDPAIDEAMLESAYMQSKWADWKNVTIVGTDHWAITGLRHLLAPCGGIRLKVFNHLPERDAWGEPDVVIWMRERFDTLPELAAEILQLRRLHPKIKQLVISDFLPPGLTFPHKSPFNGITLAQAKESIELLRNKIAALLSGKPVKEGMVKEILTPGQWRVLCMMANGANTRQVATLSNTSIKTVLTQRGHAMLRLGLRNRVELAFVLRGIVQMQQIVPAVLRRVPPALRTSRA